MLNIGNKTFMNLQEAVGWLLENNALPFQSTANYVGNTEIAMSTLINPSPAKVRVGSLIFFADSKVSTVVGVTSNSFIVSDQYNDLVDDVVYVSGVALNASGHLIVTLSNGNTIDAGLVKQVTGFSIDGSQHLIVSYNDGTTADLGAIFSGNITISGNLTVTGSINGEASPSVKPIYCHPLTIYFGTTVLGDKSYAFIGSAMILNNSNTSFASYFNNIYNYMLNNFTRLNVSGTIRRSDDHNIWVSQLYVQNGHIYVVGKDDTGANYDESNPPLDLYDIIGNIRVIDGVNKIN